MQNIATKPRKTSGNCPKQDRLTQIIKYANELSDFRLREIKNRRAKRWPPEKRAEKAKIIQMHKPWKHACGPKTAAGRAISSQNAARRPDSSPGLRMLERALRDQGRFLRQYKMLRALGENNWPDAARMIKDLMETADDITRRIRDALVAMGVDTAALDARLLVMRGAGFSGADLITNGRTPLPQEAIEKIENMASRRLAGEPVSRILGEKEFWSLSFKVSPDTLDPRPDTETLVAAALKNTPLDAPIRILDLGTGTGCILISLLTELPHATGVAVDINPGALAVAKENASRHGVGSRIDFRHGSWFEPIQNDESFHLIVSNPPYIPAKDIESLAREVRNHDPILALSGGVDGLDAYKIILDGIKKHLACGGRALFEIGQGQEDDLARLSEDSGLCVRESYRDLGGIIRVVEMSCGEK